eukprot:2786268-Amphidinium_carterae.1
MPTVKKRSLECSKYKAITVTTNSANTCAGELRSNPSLTRSSSTCGQNKPCIHASRGGALPIGLSSN